MTCATETVIEYVQDDTRPSIRVTYTDQETGDPIDVTGWLIYLLVAKTTPLSRPGYVVDGPNGILQVDPEAGDMDEVGKFISAIKLDDQAGGIETFQGYFKIQVVEKIA